MIRSIDPENWQSESGENYFRHFTEIEHHYRWSPNLVQHLRYTGARDLDIVRDFQQFTEPKTLSSDMGLTGFADYRQDLFSLSVQGNYLRNQLVQDSEEFDKNYVQTLPQVSLSSIPISFLQTDYPMFQHLAIHLDGSFTRFRQLTPNEDDDIIRNTNRITANPTLYWQMLSLGPISLRSEIQGDYQKYQFDEAGEPDFEKNVTLIKTELAFTVDRIFGLAFQEKVPYKKLSPEEIKELENAGKNQIIPIQQEKTTNKLIGELKKFDTSITNDEVMIQKNSYRHLQEYKFIHHYIPESNSSGNKRFANQIVSSAGWFDYTDAIRANEFRAGGNATRTVIPPQNTVEFQWNNYLIKKSPKNYQQWMFDEKD